MALGSLKDVHMKKKSSPESAAASRSLLFGIVTWLVGGPLAIAVTLSNTEAGNLYAGILLMVASPFLIGLAIVGITSGARAVRSDDKFVVKVGRVGIALNALLLLAPGCVAWLTDSSRPWI